MRFSLLLNSKNKQIIPINYQYPLSAAIYKIIKDADKEYAEFLHETGYGKGFKLFCFSDLRGKFKAEGDRLKLLNDRISFEISFHLPEASQNFIKGLFMSQQMDIADKKSQVSFIVQTVETLPNPFKNKSDKELVQVRLELASACVVGLNE